MAPNVDMSKLPSAPIRILVFVHFVLVTWASLSNLTWLPLGYILSNYFVILLGLWAERDNESSVPVQFFLIGMLFTILNDIICLGVNYRYQANTSINHFTAGMAIIHILFKPVSCAFIFKEWQIRAGVATPGPDAGNYENINNFDSRGNPPPAYMASGGQPFP